MADQPLPAAYFEGVADIEANTSKELTKLGAVIQVPFRAGNQFLGEGGMQVSSMSVSRSHRKLTTSHRTSSTPFETRPESSPTRTQTSREPSIPPLSSTCRSSEPRSRLT
jgi:hypothetical protein